jgi:hypothetical protein
MGADGSEERTATGVGDVQPLARIAATMSVALVPKDFKPDRPTKVRWPA